MKYIYMDLGDARGEIDITSYVSPDSLTFSLEAFNSNFMRSANTCSFKVTPVSALLTTTYTPSIMGKAKMGKATMGSKVVSRYITRPDEVKVRIFEDNANDPLPGYTAAIMGIAKMGKTKMGSGQVKAVFTGYSPFLRNINYNGILDLESITFSATDSSDKLYRTLAYDTPADELVLYNAYILNRADQDNSIIHQLIYRLGYTDAFIAPGEDILEQIAVFAPNLEDIEIGSIIENMLYEFGYSLSMDYKDRLLPIKWMHTESSVPVATFDDSNIINEVKITESARAYDGLKLTYYNIGKGITTANSSDIKLFQDSNLPKSSDNRLSGYVVYAGFKYPPETNVMDTETNLPTRVYQDYDSTSISYWTNKGIVEDLDYNYKAFDSDFTDIIATEDVYIDYYADPGLVLTKSDLYNKKAEILFNNPTSNNLKLYWCDIYGKVWYKTAERSISVDLILNPYKYKEYTASYIYKDEQAAIFSKYMAANLNLKSAKYTFSSATRVDIGALVYVDLLDGTYQKCLVMTRSYKESGQPRADIQIYDYVLLAISALAYRITKRTLLQNPTTNTTLTNYGIMLDKTALIVTADADGTNPVLDTAIITLSIIRDSSTDVTDSWAITATPSTGITGTLSGNIYTLTGLTAESGTITFTATRNSRVLTISATVNMLKNGGAGEDGNSAPKYLGALVSLPSAPNADDFFLVAATFGAYILGHIYKYSLIDDVWSEITTANADYSYYLNVVSYDALMLAKTTSSVVLAATAYINNIVSNKLKLQTLDTSTGAIYGGDRYNADGSDNDTAETGFWLGADGVLKAKDGIFTGLVTNDYLRITEDTIKMYSAGYASIPTPADGDAIIEITTTGINFLEYITGRGWLTNYTIAMGRTDVGGGAVLGIHYSQPTEMRGKLIPDMGIDVASSNYIYGVNTENSIFSTLAPFILSVNNRLRLSGGFSALVSVMWVVRTSNTTMQFVGMNGLGTADVITITNGDSTTRQCAFCW